MKKNVQKQEKQNKMKGSGRPLQRALSVLLSFVMVLSMTLGDLPGIFMEVQADDPAASVTIGGVTTNFENFDGENSAVAAWNTAGAGATLTLLKDVTTTGITVIGGTEAKPKVLDLNGYGIRMTDTSGREVIRVGEGTNAAYLKLEDSRTEDVPVHYITLENGRGRSVSDSGTEGDNCIRVSGGYITGGCRAAVSSNPDNNGGAVRIKERAQFTMSGGSIVGNTGVCGIGVLNEGSFAMSGGSIVGNTGVCGIGVLNEGSFAMSDGMILSNTGEQGGGVLNEGRFTMSGGEISGNTALACEGGGVYNVGSGTFIMSGGKISGNSADYGGGGVFVEDGTFILSGGEISGNNADFGGGVYNGDVYIHNGIEYNGGFTMTGGNIRENSAKMGGGVCNFGYFELSGGEISANSVTFAYSGGLSYAGGGVLAWGAGFRIKGSPLITGNTHNESCADDNVCIGGEAGITLTGALDDEARIGVSMETPGVYPDTPGIFTDTASENVSWNDARKFVSDDPEYSVILDSETKQLQLCYGISYIDHSVSGSGETAKAEAVDKICDDYLLLEDNDEQASDATLPLADGKYYVVTGNVTITPRILVEGTVNLILCDGCTLTAKKGITVGTGTTLNIFAQSDGKNMGKLIVPGGSSTNEYYAAIGGGSDGAVCGTVNIHGGNIDVTGYNGAGIGGGRGKSGNGGDGGTVTIYGGKVSAKAGDIGIDAGIGGGGSNASGGNGGDGGIVTIYGGSVNAGSSGGAAIGGGGATKDGNKGGKGAEVTIYGGNVTAQSNGGGAGIGGGGGIPGDGNTVTIYGGKVTAVAGSGGPAIGHGGESGDNGNLILGSNVKLYGGSSAGPENDEANLIPKQDDDYARYKFMTAIYTEPDPAPVYTYYTVKFDMQGHGEQVSKQRVRSGSKVRKPEDPAEEGYDFGGWFTDKDCTQEYDFKKAVRKSFTLYAGWTEKEPEANLLKSIRITTAPDKLSYIEGELFDPSGMVVTAVYSDESEKPVTGYTYAPAGELSVNDTVVTVSYTEEEICRTAMQAISVSAKGGEIASVHSPLDPVPLLSEETTELFLVQGQKFTMPEKGWSTATKTDKAIISVSAKTGLVKAKKAGNAVLQLTVNGEVKRSINVSICKPVIVKSLSLKTGQEEPAQIGLDGYDKEQLDVYWISSAPDVATVDQSGFVTPVGRGKATVTAYINGKAYKCTVTVTEQETAKERTLHMVLGGIKSLSIKGVKKPSWSSADEDIAGFDKNKVTAKAAGETVLTATAQDGTEYRVKLIVEDITLGGNFLEPQKRKNGSLLSNKYTLTLIEGQSTELSFADVSQPVVFKSSKAESAFIDENGAVSARKAGKSKFTTKINGKTVTVNVTVEAAQ